jgi:hypothetical protein
MKMDSSLLFAVVIPVGALLLTAVVVLVLYLWWSTGRDDVPASAPLMTDPAGESQGYNASTGPAAGDPFASLRPAAADPFPPGAASAQPNDPDWLQALSSAPPSPDLVEVMRVYRDRRDGSLLLVAEGQQFRTLRDIDDPQIGKRLVGNAHDIARFARVGEIAIPPIDPLDLIPPRTTASPPPPQPVAPSPITAPPPPPPGRPLAPAAKIEEEAEAFIPSRSMQEEIEELLQQRLPRTPFAGRDIHVRNAVGGGILIEVDGKYFEGVGEVPYPDVQELIRSVVQEWESLQ